MLPCSFSLANSRPANSLLLEFRAGHGMRRGYFVAQLFAGSVHRLAANRGCYGGIHHQLGEAARGLIERQRRFAKRGQIVALL